MGETDHAAAAGLMDAFARRTGLDGSSAPQRYLWTDAYAACNFLGLARAGGGDRFAGLAQTLVDQVHAVLGHFRADDSRTGWLCGAHGSADADHPTRAGLRIGKPLPERRPDAPFDEALEWERDGQYFHYLTRWMHALDRLARARDQPRLGRWARELAGTADRAFTYPGQDGELRMYWKMSTDLSRPLVASMGQHDPLDGLVTCLSLCATPTMAADAREALEVAASHYLEMLDEELLPSADPLGIGGLLTDALRLHRLRQDAHRPLLDRLLDAAAVSLRRCRLRLDTPAGTRLGFRELGLAIGLAAIERLASEAPDDRRTARRLGTLHPYLPLRQAINRFWLQPSHRATASWTGHLDINEVMLATSLAPEGWLG